VALGHINIESNYLELLAQLLLEADLGGSSDVQ
jgi:hypothetical protein